MAGNVIVVVAVSAILGAAEFIFVVFFVGFATAIVFVIGGVAFIFVAMAVAMAVATG